MVPIKALNPMTTIIRYICLAAHMGSRSANQLEVFKVVLSIILVNGAMTQKCRYNLSAVKPFFIKNF